MSNNEFCMECGVDTHDFYQQLYTGEKDEDGDYIKLGVLCFFCSKLRKLTEYEQSKELTSDIMRDAALAMQSLIGWAFDKWDRSISRQKYVDFVEAYSKQYFEINNSVQRVQGCVDLFCQAHLHKIHAYLDSQKTYGHTYEHQDFKILLGGSAGRILLTIQDSRFQKDPESKFGGAHITLIFAEPLKSDQEKEIVEFYEWEDPETYHLSASIQSIAATEKEACQLLVAASKALNKSFEFKPQRTYIV